jgi:hypothetical protein
MSDKTGSDAAGGGAGAGAAGGAAGAVGVGGDNGGGAGAGAAGSGGAGDSAAKGAGDEVALLRGKLAELEKREAERVAAAAEKAEAERVAKLSESQKVAEAIKKQEGELAATRAELITERRSLALDRLGVADKFKAYAPQVDPKDAEGAKVLEKWVRDNPELCRPAPGADVAGSGLAGRLAEIGKGASSALADVLAGKRKSTLVTAASVERMLSRD